MIKLSFLVAVLATAPASAQFKVFVEPSAIKDSTAGSLWVSTDLSGPLKTSINKFVREVRLVTDAGAANVILKHTATERRRGESAVKRIFVLPGAVARASVELIDKCGSILWSESATDTDRVLKVTDRIAKRLRDAMKKGRVRPCK